MVICQMYDIVGCRYALWCGTFLCGDEWLYPETFYAIVFNRLDYAEAITRIYSNRSSDALPLSIALRRPA